MKQYIKEISSDSSFKSLQVEGDYMCITVKLYTEEEIHVELEGVQAFTSPFWTTNPIHEIEGFLMTDDSEFLRATRAILEKDEETDLKFSSFQARESSGELLFEIVAKRLKVGDKTYE